ncbi:MULTISPECIES: chloride channel protein [unclassified Flavobacterium]|uniref:chloride channel protein n=1 Tax=unclassified Flavobacterium TaxID=196869 RepID=UPI0012925ACD|nr:MULTISPECIES: chloride channel protein [unclassified Flavobacterium]MQP53201.1 chloride channel protein [Flavobacterium sp. LMO9]MQP62968.1 chloride channel protein [Flavobacterium sp. LMO6]
MPRNKSFSLKTFLYRSFRRLERFIFLLKSLLTPRQFIYVSCVLVGISSALAVIVLKTFAHWVFKSSQKLDDILHLPYSNSTLPIIGIIITVIIVKKVLDDSIEKGTSQIMYSVAKKRGIMPRKQMFAQIITSSFTVGMGGSAGLESPITITGAAFGSNYAQNYRLSYKDRTLLLACGVAAGIGAAFNAPIAGVLFAVEVVLAEISITAFIPIMISAATGALISTVVLNENILFSFKKVQFFDFHNLPYYILLGVLSGFVSINYARTFRKVEHYFSKLKFNYINKALFGAGILGVLIFFFPSLFGEGYESIKFLADNQSRELVQNTVFERFQDSSWILLIFVSLTMLIKVYATSLTLGAGGNGGNFAPSLFVGSYLGFSMASFLNLIGVTKLPVGNFTLVGMAGILSGLFHAPLTAIFLIAEITGGYNLMIPLMIVSSVSFAISKRFEPHSFDIKNLADKGEVFTDNRDTNILNSIDVSKLIHIDFKAITLQPDLEELVEKIQQSDADIFPVLDDKNSLLGLVLLDEIRPIVFSQFKVKYTAVEEIMQQPKEIIFYDETLETIMDKFDSSECKVLPVLKDGFFLGFINKQLVLEKYRHRLKSMIIE